MNNNITEKEVLKIYKVIFTSLSGYYWKLDYEKQSNFVLLDYYIIFNKELMYYEDWLNSYVYWEIVIERLKRRKRYLELIEFTIIDLIRLDMFKDCKHRFKKCVDYNKLSYKFKLLYGKYFV